MTLAAIALRGRWLSAGFCCALLVAATGCNDAASGISRGLESAAGHDASADDARSLEPLLPDIAAEPETPGTPAESATAASRAVETTPADTTRPDEIARLAADDAGSSAMPSDQKRVKSEPGDSLERKFAVEGPAGALRVGFDDLDLLKILRMDPVTPDCKDKMPAWLQGLSGKPVRIRGFMKPGLLVTGIPQFLLVRDTGLCCFGPKGKIYDMIAVTLKPGTTTDYIELRPFDVVGTFRIEVVTLEDDGTIFGLYYIDDAQIVRK